MRSDLKNLVISHRAKFAASTMLILLILGFFLIMYSKCPSFVSERIIETFGSSTTLHIAVFFPDGGWYFINSTDETASFGNESRVRVYDSKENLVFSRLISSFPSSLRVDSSGYHTVILENVNFSAGERFRVYGETEDYSVLFPLYFLDVYGQALFIVGAVGFTVLLPVHYFSQREQNLNERAKLKGFIIVPKLLKITYGVLSSIAFPMVITLFINMEFCQVTSFGIFIIFLVILPTIGVFWLRIEDILAFYLLKVSYKGYLANERRIKSIIIITLFSFILFLFSPYINDVRLQFLVYGANLWVMYTCTLAFSILVSFFGFLTPEGEAFLSLESFLLDYRKKDENADFGYIKKASKCVATILADRLFPVSYVKLSEHIAIQYLDPANGKSDQKDSFTIQKLQRSLHPLNLKKLSSLISTIPNIREEHPRLGVGKLLQRIYYTAVITTTLITAIKLVFRI